MGIKYLICDFSRLSRYRTQKRREESHKRIRINETIRLISKIFFSAACAVFSGRKIAIRTLVRIQQPHDIPVDDFTHGDVCGAAGLKLHSG